MKILITESKGFSKGAVFELEKHGHRVVLGKESYQTLQDKVYEFDGLIVRLGINFDKDILSRATKLKFIATCTTGLDHIDLEEAKSRGIEVISLKDETKFLETITPTAELAVGLMLAILRNIVPASMSVIEGAWDRDVWIGKTMRGKTVGIVGMGRLGKITARLVKAFGCDVVYCDPFVFSKEGRRLESLNELTEKADIVSIHVPLNKKTEGMIGAEFFNRAKKGQVIINTSRGAIVDEFALCEALKAGKIAGVGVDVLSSELEGKIENNVLVEYGRNNNNVVITPHIGGATAEAMRMTEKFMVKKVVHAGKERVRMT